MRGSDNKVGRRRFLGMTAAAAGAGGAVVATGGMTPAAGSTGRGATLPPGVDWTLVRSMSDEFHGDSLDTAKWVQEHWNDPVKQVDFVEQNVTVSDGLLRVRLSEHPDHDGGPYASGVVRSTFYIGGDSYTEVRAQMIDTDANANSAIWLHAHKTNVEIDMHEYLKPQNESVVRSAIHLWDSGVHVNRKTIADGPLDERFHRYGLERRAGKVVFYIDGEQYWEYGDHPVAATEPQPLIIYIRGINKDQRINPDALPACMLVDYVRVYTAG